MTQDSTPRIGAEIQNEAVRLLKEVGARLLDWRADEGARALHVPQDFKTEADRRAHLLLVEGLRALTPEAPVLSEEAEFPQDGRPSAYWLIDPIDGTASWFEGFAGFVTQLAWIQEDEAIFGAVHAPAQGATWRAARGGGAWRDERRLPLLRPHARIAVTDNYPQPRRAAQILTEAIPQAEYVESGSLGLKCCLVAEGTADLFVKDVVTRDWDIAPAAPILEAVGAWLSLPDGSPYLFRGEVDKPQGVLVARDADLAARARRILSVA